MNQTIETTSALQAGQAGDAPSLKVAFVGFVTSTTFACTVMVLLSSI